VRILADCIERQKSLGTEAQKETVLPLLLAGQKTSSLPPLLHSRVFA